MDITIPFLIFIITVSLYLLYKIAGVDFVAFLKNKPMPKPKPPEEKKPEPVVETRKSFLHKKEKKAEQKAEQKEPEKTNTPSEGAVVTQVFASKNAGESKISKAMEELEQNKVEDADILQEPENVEVVNEEATQSSVENAFFASNEPALPKNDMEIFNADTFPKPSVNFDATKNDFDNDFFADLNKKDIFSPPDADIFKPNFANGHTFPPTSNKMSINDELDDLFFNDLNLNNAPPLAKVKDENYFDNRVIGAVVATTKPKFKNFYWN